MFVKFSFSQQKYTKNIKNANICQTKYRLTRQIKSFTIQKITFCNVKDRLL